MAFYSTLHWTRNVVGFLSQISKLALRLPCQKVCCLKLNIHPRGAQQQNTQELQITSSCVSVLLSQYFEMHKRYCRLKDTGVSCLWELCWQHLFRKKITSENLLFNKMERKLFKYERRPYICWLSTECRRCVVTWNPNVTHSITKPHNVWGLSLGYYTTDLNPEMNILEVQAGKK